MSPHPGSALRAAHALRAGDLTVGDLLETCLAAIASDRRSASPVDAWAALGDADGLRRTAAELDAALSRGDLPNPLAGVPFGIKDLLDTADLPTEAGSRRWRGRRPATDAPAVALARAAGALPLGKTRTHEFAAGVTTPPTANPFDTTRTPGGSSGGSAAAVAAGQCLWAIGTDTLGSVRMPAALCGVVGLKPTYDLVSRRGVAVLSGTLDHVGVLTTDCRDAAAALDLITGAPPRPWPEEPVPGARGGRLVLGVPRPAYDVDVEPGVAAAYASAVERLAAAAGAEVRTVQLRPASQYVAIGFDVLAREAAEWHAPLLAERVAAEDDYRSDVRALLEYGRSLSDDAYGTAMAALDQVRTEARTLFSEVDVLVLPATPFVAPPRDTDEYVWPSGRVAALGADMPRFTAFGNLTGAPAVSVPVGLVDGLPVGVQLVGPHGTDHRLLRLADVVYERPEATSPAAR